jgi:hypothetical protein
MKQITFASRNHQLTNINTWTPDSQWLVYDVRPSGASFTGETIERVNVVTGEVEVIYRATDGAHVGVVTVHPARRNMSLSTARKTRMRTGTTIFIIAGVVAHHGQVSNLDAMDITAPYPGRAARRQPRPCLQPERAACQLYL